MSKGKTIGAWILTGLLVFAFLGAGGMKLAGAPELAANFERWGFPGWFLYVTGAIEVLGALLLLVPRISPIGVALLAPTMVGGALTHLVAAEYAETLPAAVLLVLVCVLGVLRREHVQEILNMFGRQSATAS